jgi:hypothetical protein
MASRFRFRQRQPRFIFRLCRTLQHASHITPLARDGATEAA